MTLQILFNLIIGLVWMLLHDEWNFISFVIGYFIGTVIIYGMRRFFPTPFYMKRLWAIIKLLYLFVKELVLSTLVVARELIRPNLTIRPGIFRVETKLRSDLEITLLSTLLTLTPGSVVMEVAPADGVMYIHAMDMEMMDSGIMKSMRIFEDAILEVTRDV